MLPAYRGESVEDEELGFFRCEGESKNDFLRDIFDAVSFLDAVRKLVPNADMNFIVTVGSSRNCSTALSIGLFVPGTRAVFASCGWCDMFAEYIKSGAIKILEDYDTSENVFTFYNSLKTDVPLSFVLHAIIFPLKDGKMTLSQARRRMLESSPAYFTKWMPKYIKINHGTEDSAVNIIQTERFYQELLKEDKKPPECEKFIYEGGDHNIYRMDEFKNNQILFFNQMYELYLQESKR